MSHNSGVKQYQGDVEYDNTQYTPCFEWYLDSPNFFSTQFDETAEIIQNEAKSNRSDSQNIKRKKIQNTKPSRVSTTRECLIKLTSFI